MGYARTAMLVAAMACLAARAEVDTAVVVIDGDTLELQGTRVRLAGISAPGREQRCFPTEPGWDCGGAAAAALAALVQAGRVACPHPPGEADAGSAVCWSAGVEINRALVAAGWALADGGRYRLEERGAATSARGIWRDGFQPNPVWRRWARDGIEGRDSSGCDACSARKQNLLKRSAGEP